MLIVAGCNRRPPTAQVSGKVQYKDGTLMQGGVRAIRFEPAEDTTAEIRKAASGNIESDGSFELFTRKPGDGVFVGKYKVTFTHWRGPRDPVSLIDPEYTSALSTPYTVTVEDDVDDLVFEVLPSAAAKRKGAE